MCCCFVVVANVCTTFGQRSCERQSERGGVGRDREDLDRRRGLQHLHVGRLVGERGARHQCEQCTSRRRARRVPCPPPMPLAQQRAPLLARVVTARGDRLRPPGRTRPSPAATRAWCASRRCADRSIPRSAHRTLARRHSWAPPGLAECERAYTEPASQPGCDRPPKITEATRATLRTLGSDGRSGRCRCRTALRTVFAERPVILAGGFGDRRGATDRATPRAGRRTVPRVVCRGRGRARYPTAPTSRCIEPFVETRRHGRPDRELSRGGAARSRVRPREVARRGPALRSGRRGDRPRPAVPRRARRSAIAPLFGARRAEWVALEDKTLADELFDATACRGRRQPSSPPMRSSIDRAVDVDRPR